MGIETSACVQTAVYWAPDTPDQYGQPTYDTPREILVRWDEVTEEFISPDNEARQSKAKVMAKEDLEVNGVLFLGELTDLDSTTAPFENDGAWQILSFKKIPFLRSTTRFFRQAWL
jgi:hypothetical protein